MKKITVVMMVKDEEAIIERALNSVVGVADRVIISDTGSSDSTIVRAALFLQSKNIPFHIHQTKFKNFAHNRNVLLTLAKLEGNTDYALMLDADEILISADGEPLDRGQLTQDYYNVSMSAGPLSYYLPRLTRIGAELEYVGVTHEFLDTKKAVYGGFSNIGILQINDSTRRKSGKKFLEDIELLKRALEQDHEIKDSIKARYYFYLAQSYMATGNLDDAFAYYQKRAGMGFWKQEVYFSHYQSVKICIQLNDLWGALRCSELATAADPTRIEHLVALRDFIDKRISTATKPVNALFLEDHLYAN